MNGIPPEIVESGKLARNGLVLDLDLETQSVGGGLPQSSSSVWNQDAVVSVPRAWHK
jgi:hypothetical protein